MVGDSPKWINMDQHGWLVDLFHGKSYEHSYVDDNWGYLDDFQNLDIEFVLICRK